MQNNRGHRGQGGVACIYQIHLQDKVSVAKVDVHHRYIWLRIKDGSKTYFIACCYIPHAGSTFYKSHGADPKDPFGDLGLDVCQFSTQGEVMVMGDLNARISKIQSQPITWNELDKDEEVNIACLWQREFQDDTINAQGRALCNFDAWYALNGFKWHAPFSVYEWIHMSYSK